MATASIIRDCKNCQQCCILFEVDGIDKKEKQNCPFLKSGAGCTQYDNRPRGCRSFNCTWIQGLGADEDNPSICGVVIQKKGTNLKHKGDKLQYVSWETKKDGFKSEAGLQAMARVSEETRNKVMMLDLDNNNKIVSICMGEGVE